MPSLHKPPVGKIDLHLSANPVRLDSYRACTKVQDLSPT
jgi:hypothetical protein